MKKNNAVRVLEEQLRSARKALKYVRSKSAERQNFMANYLKFPDLSSPVDFIGKALEEKFVD